MKWKVTLSDLDLGSTEIREVNKVLRSKWLSMGEKVLEFEKKFSQFLKAQHSVAVSSGTAALHLALKSLGIKKGDEVLVPALTFVATVNAILYLGAKPVFLDITSLEDFNLSIADLERKISPKSRAIMVVHYAGFLADMDKIIEIAKKHNLLVIEDSAHSIGAKHKLGMAGAIGDVGCFSFFSNKNLATGEGGMIATKSQSLAEKIKLLRSHGMTTLTWDRHKGHSFTYDVLELGYNYRMTEISAVLGMEQLKKLKKNNLKRKALFLEYLKRLKDVQGITVPFQNYPRDSAFHIFPILLDNKKKRDKFIAEMKKKGIQTSCHYPPVHLFTYYKEQFGYKSGFLPLTEEVGKREITLPLHPLLKIKDVELVCDSLKRSLKSC
jgi:dTDP-4-amino-4,6-dideoxygalactose transaminase